MSISDRTVEVTLTLPKGVYEHAARTAASEQRKVEELLSSLVAEGLVAHQSVREILEHASAQYRARLDGVGRLDQSSDEVLQELAEVREQIARELYP